MDENSLLSVVIPIYNVEPYINRCLDSIISQTYRNLEIICVDDGSTDNSGKIADEYAKIDERIVVIHKKNEGLVSARKCGLLIAHGLYTTYVDSDDWAEPNMYEEMMELAFQHNADIVTSGAYRDYETYIVPENERVRKGKYDKTELEKLQNKLVSLDRFFQANISVHLWNKIYRTKLLLKHQLNVSNLISIGEDVVVSYPAIWDADTVVVSGGNYYHYCLRPNSVMGTHKKNDSLMMNEVLGYIENYIKKEYSSNINIIVQLNILKVYLGLFRNLQEHVWYRDGELYPFGEISSSENVAIYGAGKFGKELYEYVKVKNWFANIIWVDTDGKNGATKIDNIEIGKIDKIVIAVLLAEIAEEIEKILVNKGVSQNKILRIHPSYER